MVGKLCIPDGFSIVGACLSIFIVIVFAFLAVGYQTYRVTVLNPSETLKYG